MPQPPKNHSIFSGVVAAFFVFLPIHASKSYAQGIDLSHGGQITVTAVGGFDWNQNTQTVTAYNQAQAVRGDVTVLADQLIAYYRKKAPKPGEKKDTPTTQGKSSTPDDTGANEIYRLEAIGHVHIFTHTDQAWGDRALYDIDQAALVMTGKAMKLTTPQDVLTARDSMEYYSQTHISIGRGDATVTTNEGKQVKADVLVGYSDPDQNNTQPKPAKASQSQGSGGGQKLKKVNAFGHVVVRTQLETITGDRGVYVPDTGIARILGNVIITRGSNQLNGAEAIINMHTGIATMTQSPGNRVHGLVVPNETSPQTSPSAPNKN
ncbi:LptA/OstA family protein [Entomobacter blattae]|uniref:OstA-like protein n=1 Tax=Entomobacter blattae TaxID=2762277 RepID=A0A7H1NSN5_9PROT|nr:LptA/OstA family protein [Entomobacter blattae]QNT78795.1 OstA-like protein [Entomobacter blattae]